MKSVLRLLAGTLFLTLAPLTAHAQEGSLLATDKPIDDPGNIPATTIYLMLLSYSCQEVTGIENYTEIKTLTHSMSETIMQDKAGADEFVAQVENMAREGCPDTTTCWREFNSLPATATVEEGQQACLGNINNGLTLLGKQMENLLAETDADTASSSAIPE